MSEQLLFMWSTFRDSNIGTKLKCISEGFMRLCSPPEIFHKNMFHEQLLFMWSTLRDSSMGTKQKHFWKTHEIVKSAWNFFTKTCLTNNYFSRNPLSVILAWVQSWNNYEKLMKLWCPNNYFSCDPHFVILAWVQNWNIFEKLMKL